MQPQNEAVIQMILNENTALIKIIENLQASNNVQECVQYHQKLYKNLVYIAIMGGLGLDYASKLPPPPDGIPPFAIQLQNHRQFVSNHNQQPTGNGSSSGPQGSLIQQGYPQQIYPQVQVPNQFPQSGPYPQPTKFLQSDQPPLYPVKQTPIQRQPTSNVIYNNFSQNNSNSTAQNLPTGPYSSVRPLQNQSPYGTSSNTTSQKYLLPQNYPPQQGHLPLANNQQKMSSGGYVYVNQPNNNLASYGSSKIDSPSFYTTSSSTSTSIVNSVSLPYQLSYQNSQPSNTAASYNSVNPGYSNIQPPNIHCPPPPRYPTHSQYPPGYPGYYYLRQPAPSQNNYNYPPNQQRNK